MVASPALVRVSCHTPRQMQLANALCRLVEVAQEDERREPAVPSLPGEPILPVAPASTTSGPTQLTWLDGGA